MSMATISDYPFAANMKMRVSSTGFIVDVGRCTGYLFAANLVVTSGIADKNYLVLLYLVKYQFQLLAWVLAT